jgi:hypothetical protein
LHNGYLHKETDIGLERHWTCLQYDKVTAEWSGESNRKTGREMACINITTFGIRYLYCAQKQNIFQTVYEKCVPCTKTEHFPDGTSEICTEHTNRTLSG